MNHLPASNTLRLWPIEVPPVLALAIALMAGILSSHYITLPLVLLLAFAAVSLLGIFLCLGKRWRIFPIALVLTFWWVLGASAYHVCCQRCPQDDLVRYSDDKPVLVRLRGQALDDTNWVESDRPWPADPTLYFPLKATQIQTHRGWTATSGSINVSVNQPSRTITTGQHLELLGNLSRYQPGYNPGQFDWQKYNRFQGRLVKLRVDSGAAITLLSSPDKPLTPGLLARLRRHFATVLTGDDDSSASSSLLKAMVLGQRDSTFPQFVEVFQKTGLFHLLCVSGQNLAILAGFIWLMSMIIGLSRRISALLVLALVLFYAILVPAQPPILRAAVIVVMLCLGKISGRNTDVLHSLSLAALLILLFRPTDIFDVGFQLSFVIVAGLVVLCPRLARFLLGDIKSHWTADPGTHYHPQVERLGQWVWLWFIRLLSTCIIAWFVCLPLVIYYFGYFNPWAAFYSLLIVPFASVIMVGGYLTSLLGCLLPFLAGGLRVISLALAGCLNNSAILLARIPGILEYLPAPSLSLLLAFYAWLILLAVRPALSRRYKWPWLARAWMVPSFLAIFAAYIYSAGPLQPKDTLCFHLLSVGNGQTSILQFSNGSSLAFDAGSMNQPDVTTRTIMPFLRTRHLRRLDAIVLSHPNRDHYSGASVLINAVHIRDLMTSPYFRGKSAPKEIAEILSSAGNITVIGSPGRLTGMQPAQVEILWPPAQTNQTIQITPNDSSLVLRITYAGWRILLTGDITSTAQGLLLANHADLGADVLVWPHHGGVVNTTGAFFQAVNPDIILVSCAQDRAERIRGMTSTDLLAGRRLYTTAENGALSVFVNRAGIEVRPFIPK